MKKLIKSFIFIIIFLFLWNHVFKVLNIDKRPIRMFYDEPKNSLDIVYIGSSNAYAHFNTVLSYKKYGFTTGLLSSDTLPFPSIKYLIKESKKYQNPSVYIIDISTIIINLDEYDEGMIRKVSDSMKFSKNRIDLINTLLKLNNTDKKEYKNYYFNYLKYHNVWKSINEKNFGNNKNLFKGFYINNETIVSDNLKPYIWSSKVIKLPQDNKDVLLDLINYIKSNNINSLFVIPKRTWIDNRHYGLLNDAIKTIETNGLKIINFNKIDMNIDFARDYYNYAHLNIYGSTKYTMYFSKYLKENYNLKDHRNDKKYQSWDSEYDRFKETFKNLTNKNFEEVLSDQTN